MSNITRGFGWIPFFLILLFYQRTVSSATTLNRQNSQSTPTQPQDYNIITSPETPSQAENPEDAGPILQTQNVPSTNKFDHATVDPSDSKNVPELQIIDTPLFVIRPKGRINPVQLLPTTRLTRKQANLTELTANSMSVNTNITSKDNTTKSTITTTQSSGSEEIKLINVIEKTFDPEQLETLTSYIKRKYGADVDFANLLTQYTNVCPTDKQCNFLTPDIQDFSSSFKNEFDCPYYCDCDPKCVGKKNCCPGTIYAYTDHECVNVRVLPTEGKSTYDMVAKCPSTFKDDLVVGKCESHNDQSSIEPVTSRDTILTYKNRFCAICHGEMNVTKWKLTVKCPVRVDFEDEFQSFSDMQTQLVEQNCEIDYDLDEEDQNIKPISCKPSTSNVNLIDQCNTTGLWFEEDRDILWACQHFNGVRYLNYRNIFCFLCNPSIASSNMQLIYDKCNITENWAIYDGDLESACLIQPEIPRLFPYKNVYCIMCNGVKTLSQYRRNMYKTETMEVAVLETLKSEHSSVLTLDIDFIGENKVDNFVEFVETMYGGANAINKDNTYTLEKLDVPDKVIENQIKDYISICGSPWSCENSVGFNPPVKLDNNVCSGLLMCSCDEDCIEMGNCCTELILKYRPYTCLNRSSILHHTADTPIVQDVVSHDDDDNCYSVVDKCRLRSLDDVNMNLTEGMPETLSYLPVKYGRITYRNISYMMCNVKDYKSIHIDIEVECGSYFEKALVNGIDHFETLINLTKQFCNSTFASKSSYLDHDQDDGKWGYTRSVRRSRLNPLNNSIDLSEIPRSLLVITDSSKGDLNKTIFTECNQTGLWAVNDENTRKICENPEYLGTNLPEFRINGLVYKNYACYICNPEIDATTVTDEDLITSCNVTGLAMKDTMPLSEMERLCQTTELQARWLPFKNYYCSRCNLPRLLISQSTFEVITQHMQNREFDVSSYRTLFSLSMAEFTTMMKKREVPECINGTYDYVLEMCRPLFCRTGRVLQNNTCRPLIENGESLSYEIALTLRVASNQSSGSSLHNSTCAPRAIGRTDKLDLEGVIVEFKTAMSEKLVSEEENIPHSFSGCEIYSDIHCLQPDSGGLSIVYANLLKEIHLKCHLYVFKTSNRSALESILVDALMDSYTMQTVDGNNICLEATPQAEPVIVPNFDEKEKCMFYEPQLMFLSSKKFSIDRFFTCVQIQLDQSEFQVDNTTGDLLLKTLNVSVQQEYYYINGSEARMCLEDYVTLTAKSNITGPTPVNELLIAYNRFSEVCTILSMVCLFITFVTYCVFASLRTLPGKNNMALCFGLFCAQGTLQFGMNVEDVNDIPFCTIMGVLIHYFWLATFFAMNICSFHMFRVFCSKAMSVPSSSKRRFTKYVVYIYGMPLIIVSVTLAAFMVSSNGTFSGYGDGRCFLTNIYGVISAFIIPSSIIFILNIIFFILAFHKIRTSPRIQSSGDKREFFVYIKLCTVVGLTWPLQIIDAVLPLTLFSFFVVAINASQGVFVCLSYVCNRRVFFLYKKCCSRDSSLMSASSVKTSSTDLHMSDRPKRNGH